MAVGGLCCLAKILILGRGMARCPQRSAPLPSWLSAGEQFLEVEQKTYWGAGDWQQVLLPGASLKCFLVRKSQLQEFIAKKEIFMLCVRGFWCTLSQAAGVHQHGAALVAWKRALE